jgi:hypothetical protein
MRPNPLIAIFLPTRLSFPLALNHPAFEGPGKYGHAREGSTSSPEGSAEAQQTRKRPPRVNGTASKRDAQSAQRVS